MHDDTATPNPFANFSPDPDSPLPPDVQKAVHLARLLQERASQLQTPQERKQQTELDRLLANPRDRATLMQITDQAFRSEISRRASDQLIHILDVQGIPRFFSPVDRTLLKGFQSFGEYLPGVAFPLVKEKMRHETANVILPAEENPLKQHLTARRSAGVRMNVNYLGEALLGETAAQHRLNSYLAALQLPVIEVISVKISTLYSQISPLAREQTIRTLCDRMELLYRAAAKAQFVRPDGSQVPKFVYLDMEEYRDMTITAEVFMQTLDRPGLENVSAGIALQAYIPDSFPTQERINAWARHRVSAGGAPVTIRIVKGANMEMERVDASIHGWPQAPYKSKIATDANYKRMLHEGMRPENLHAVRLGVASHNLFDLAYALVLAAENPPPPQPDSRETSPVQFEMLEGMANHQRRALFELTQHLLLYAPACKKNEFVYAIGYLIRRMDENSGPENFLRHAFKLEVNSPEWNRLELAFLASFRHIEQTPTAPRRTQDRRLPPPPPASPSASASASASASLDAFANEPPTDFSLPHNAAWAETEIYTPWKDRHGNRAGDIPLVIAGADITENRAAAECFDPSRPHTVVGRYRQATREDIDRVVTCAANDPDGWRDLPPADRSSLLANVAREIRLARARLMGAALADAGKTLLESDPEISEAVDFVEFYRRSAGSFFDVGHLHAQPRGVVVVISPWNFPIAIPCGGIAAALAAGNTVILKPSSDAVLVAHELCQCFWRAGVSKNILQFTPCTGSTAGNHLASHPNVDSVIFTGGTETALSILNRAPHIRLLAETGGKNATIVTALADRDQAIKNVLHSAFSHSGQKCSATSLLILESEIFEDAHFKRELCDAAASLPVGSAWNPSTKIGPLIHPPRDKLERALTQLEEEESWALMPEIRDENSALYSPAIKWNVQPGSFTHMTELFGPVLAVVKADNLHHAIAIANQTGFGLTAGIESLDDREREIFRDHMRAGNLYLNRPTTGAIVLRQPFGGLGKSAIGPGIKAGGPNYVSQLMTFTETGTPRQTAALPNPKVKTLLHALANPAGSHPTPPLPRDDLHKIVAAIHSYSHAAETEFAKIHDHFRLLGQDNLRRYLPVRELRIRLHPEDTAFEIFARVCAAVTAGCRVTLSTPPASRPPAIELLEEVTESWGSALKFIEESDDDLAAILQAHNTDRLRYASPDRVPPIVRTTAAALGFYIADTPVLIEGRLELLQYVAEQSISSDYHRYGNLGPRSAEDRAEPA